MARVYSWQIQDTPRTYSYIVDPNNTSNIYIGVELVGDDLNFVRDWASNCTDLQYIEHFNLMVDMCEREQYNVSFDDVEVYMNIKSSCDNLRGPAGRGIKQIIEASSDHEYTYYDIIFDDNGRDTFRVKNGRDGVDGKDGAKGDTGVSTKMIFIYASGAGLGEGGGNGTPNKPVGGTFSFETNKLNNEFFTNNPQWTTENENIAPPVWMANATIYSTSPSAIIWSAPIQVTGEDGQPGTDGISSEFIYFLTKTEPNKPENDPDVSNYIPGDGTTWTDSPTGVDEDNPIEWCCVRNFNNETKKWGDWQGPSIWSKYGVNGMDGDGVQYIFLRNRGSVPVNPTPVGFDVINTSNTIGGTSVYTLFQDKNMEWLPAHYDRYENIWGEPVVFEPVFDENDESNIIAGVWTDEPIAVDVEYQYQWVSSRKYKTIEKEVDGKLKTIKEWTKYSDPALWAKFGEDGKDSRPRVIRKLYALSTSTNNPPEKPHDAIFSSDWGTGFPKDYRNGENVVWATEAEIWADDSSFVGKYDEVANPTDVTMDNVKNVDVLPVDKIENESIRYLLYGGKYYEWNSGGWCEPFLVTGTKGEGIAPANYTTYAFAYGLSCVYPPVPTSKNIDDLGYVVSVITGNTKEMNSLPSYQVDDAKYLTLPNSLTHYEWVDGEYIPATPIDLNVKEVSDLPSEKDSNKNVEFLLVNNYYYYWDGDSYEPCQPSDSVQNNTTEVSEIPSSKLEIKYILIGDKYYEWVNGAYTGVNGEPEDLTDLNYKVLERVPSTKIELKYIKIGNKFYEWSIIDNSYIAYTATINVKSVTRAPSNVKIDNESIKYLFYDKKYYQWDNNVKSYTDYQPIDKIFDRTYTIDWVDFPDTSTGNVDGYIDNNGYERRWYQCNGKVENITGEITLWSEVFPCTPRDGERGPTGNYYEFRYGITETTAKPILRESENGKFIREPKLFNSNGLQWGWFTTGDNLPTEIPTGGAMWQIWAEINSETNEIMGSNGWNGPTRVSGEKGEQGPPGPAGLRGTSGIPGANYKAIYCLGTESAELKNYFSDIDEVDDVFVDGFMSDGYFGDVIADTTPEMPENYTGWFTNKNIPYADPIKVSSINELNETKTDANIGRVVDLITSDIITVEGSSIRTTLHTFYLVKVGINGNISLKQLTGRLTNEEKEKFNVYVWCIQGSEEYAKTSIGSYQLVSDVAHEGNTFKVSIIPSNKVQGNDYDYLLYYDTYYKWKNDAYVVCNPIISTTQNTKVVKTDPTNLNTEDKDVKYLRYGDSFYEWIPADGELTKVIDWGRPFKLQGTNGLRGLAGTRGQVVYPMGTYNAEQVYITTEEKAPYVYDPGDGMFYVYNIVNTPWVGLLPGSTIDDNGNIIRDESVYKKIMIHPTDYANNYRILPFDEVNKKYYLPLKYESDVKYFYHPEVDYDIKDENIIENCYYSWDGSKYAAASRFKYYDYDNGSWMVDQNGEVPSTNYANATNENNQPAWVRFESFEALYTSIGIIANGMIGSAVYNNEFMFSQQGIGQDGESTNYAFVSAEDVEYGFLSAYEYNEDGIKPVMNPNKTLYWHYKDTDVYLDDTLVNPYECFEFLEYHYTENNTAKVEYYKLSGDAGDIYRLTTDYISTATTKQVQSTEVTVEGEGDERFIRNQVGSKGKFYIHTFMPNVCINFSTGQMWLATGKMTFGESYGNVYTADEVNGITIPITEKLDTWADDGWLSPSELRLLRTEYNKIQTEKPQLEAQAITLNMTGATSWNDYITAYTNIIVACENYYLNSDTSRTNNSIKVLYEGVGNYKYFEEYYNARDVLTAAFSSKLQSNIESAKDSISAETKSLFEQLSGITDDIKEQADKRAKTYYQSDDPAEVGKWQDEYDSIHETYAGYRVGDLWYNISNKRSYIFTNDEFIDTTSTPGIATTNTGISDNYYWAESYVPQGVYDIFDRKSNIFVEQPIAPYYVGDLWFAKEGTVGGFVSGETTGHCYSENYELPCDTILVCLETNTGDTYCACHWGKRDSYADEAIVEQAKEDLQKTKENLSLWASDNIISYSERNELLRELEEIHDEYPSITAQTVHLTGFTAVTNNLSAYTSAYISVTNAISSITNLDNWTKVNLNPDGSENAEEKSWYLSISGGTGKTEYAKIAPYYDARQKLLQSISDALNGKLEKYKTELEARISADTKELGDYIDKEILSTKNEIGVKLDGKIDTYYEGDDPALEWLTYISNGSIDGYNFTYGYIGTLSKLGVPSNYNAIDAIKIFNIDKTLSTSDKTVYCRLLKKSGNNWIIAYQSTKSKTISEIPEGGSYIFSMYPHSSFTETIDINDDNIAIVFVTGDTVSSNSSTMLRLKSVSGISGGIANPISSLNESSIKDWSPALEIGYVSNYEDLNTHIGDLWYTSNNSYTFVKDDYSGEIKNNIDTATGYKWVVQSNVPQAIYDSIDSKSSVYIVKPKDADYRIGDLWYVESNNYSGETFAGQQTGITSGTCLVCVTARSNNLFSYLHWGKRDHYADEAAVANAQAQVDATKTLLTNWSSDGNVDPSERAELAKMGKEIEREYPIITAQTSGLTGITALTAYTAATHNAISGINYFTNPDNCIPSGDPSGYIPISGNESGYTAIPLYYEKKASLLKNISDCLNKKINDNYNSLFNKITAETSSITSTIEAYKGEVSKQLDGKLNTYVSDSDPSSDWTSETDLTLHINDLWYTSGKTYTFVNSGYTGNYDSSDAISAACGNGYKWIIQTDVPTGLYDYIDGKASVFVTKPTPPYNVGDLWLTEKDYEANFITGVTFNDNGYVTRIYTGKTTISKGTLMTCLVQNTGKNFSPGHWGKRDSYADEAFVKSISEETNKIVTSMKDWAADKKLSPEELTKFQSYYRYYKDIFADLHNKLNAAAITCNIPSETGTKAKTYYEDFTNWYSTNNSKYMSFTNALNQFSPNLLVKDEYGFVNFSAKPVSNQNVTFGDCYEVIINYLEAREKLSLEISKRTNEMANSALTGLTTLEYIQNTFGPYSATTDFNGVVLSKLVGVTSTNGNLRGFMNGHSGLTYTERDVKKPVMLCLGMKDVSNEKYPCYANKSYMIANNGVYEYYDNKFYAYDRYPKQIKESFNDNNLCIYEKITNDNYSSNYKLLNVEECDTDGGISVTFKNVGSVGFNKSFFASKNTSGQITLPNVLKTSSYIHTITKIGTIGGLPVQTTLPVRCVSSTLTSPVYYSSVDGKSYQDVTNTIRKDILIFDIGYVDDDSQIAQLRNYMDLKCILKTAKNGSTGIDTFHFYFMGETTSVTKTTSQYVCTGMKVSNVLTEPTATATTSLYEWKSINGSNKIYLEYDNNNDILSKINSSYKENNSVGGNVVGGLSIYSFDKYFSNKYNLMYKNGVESVYLLTSYKFEDYDNKCYMHYNSSNSSPYYVDKIQSAPTVILEDGTIVANRIKLNLGKFEGKLDAKGIFEGYANITGGTFEGSSVKVDDSVINNSITIGDIAIDSNENVSSNSASLRQTLSTYSKSVENHNGENAGKEYPWDYTFLSQKTINSGHSSIEIPSFSYEFKIENSEYYTTQAPRYIKLTLKTNKGDTVLHNITGFTLSEGSTAGNKTAYYRGTLTGTTIKDSGITSLTLHVEVKFHLNTYSGWFGGKKAKGTVTVKPNSTLNVNYPSDANCFLIGKNGIKFINGNTKLIIYPNYFKIQAGTYGIAAKSGTDKKGLCVSLADDKLNYCHVGLENGNLKVDTQNITI